MRETQVQSLGWEDPLEKAMATHSSTLAWKILWTEEPGRLQSTGSQRVRHHWVTSLSLNCYYCIIKLLLVGLPCGSAGQESTCHTGALAQFLGREDPVKKDRLPTPVFLGFPVAQLVKSPPAMWETWVRSLGWEDPLEKRKATHTSILAWRIPWTV